MHPAMNRIIAATGLLAVVMTTACSQQDSGTTSDKTTLEPPAAPEPVVQVAAPAGTYGIDPNHATVGFTITHMGLAPYMARFTDFDATLELRDELAASAIALTIDPASVETDYDGDYQATHPDSPFDSWEEDLARSDKFFNAGEYPEITFTSTVIEPLGGNLFAVTGDLSMLGQVHPVELEVEITGSVASHPFTSAGAIGFSARGSFMRSTFGMDYLLNPPLLADEVNLVFAGEFLQQTGGAGGE